MHGPGRELDHIVPLASLDKDERNKVPHDSSPCYILRWIALFRASLFGVNGPTPAQATMPPRGCSLQKGSQVSDSVHWLHIIKKKYIGATISDYTVYIMIMCNK